MTNLLPIISAKAARCLLRRTNSITIRRLTRLHLRKFFTQKSFLVGTNEGFKMKVSPRGYTSHKIYFFGEYDFSMSSFIKHYIEPDDHCIDIGAEQGWFSLLMASLTGKNSKIFSFEPFTNNYEKLKYNIQVNRFSWIVPINKAVCDRPCAQYFIPPTSSLLQQNSGVFEDNSGVGFVTPVNQEGSIEVKATSLDDYFSRIETGKIKLIKLDIEGGEENAIKGGLSLIDKLSPILIIEYNEIALNRSGSSTEILHNILLKLDYNVYTLSKNRLKKFNLSNYKSKNIEKQFCNVYCLRK